MLQILQARLQQYVNREIPGIQAGFRKGRGTRDQTANIRWITEKTRKFQKNIYFCFTNYTKWITTNCGKFWKKWEYQITLPTSWENCMQVKNQQLEPDMKQWTSSKLGKEYVKTVYCNPAYLIICRVHHTKFWTGKGQFSFQSQRRAMPKNVQAIPHNCTHFTC